MKYTGWLEIGNPSSNCYNNCAFITPYMNVIFHDRKDQGSNCVMACFCVIWSEVE